MVAPPVNGGDTPQQVQEPDSGHSTPSQPAAAGSSPHSARHRRPSKRDPYTSDGPISRAEQLKLLAKTYRTEISASSASVLSTTLAFPLDTVKTRLQAYGFFTSFSDCVRQTYRDEGVRGFWRGVLSPLLSITLVRTISFSVYQQSKYTFDDWIYKATGKSPLVTANTKGAYPDLSTVACFGLSGMVSGAVITFVACPFEITKNAQQLSQIMEKRSRADTDLQIARSYRDKRALATAIQIVKNRGWTGLYSGVSYHFLRDTIGTSVYFMTYETVKQLLANSRGGEPTSPRAVVIAGGICGIVSWACIFPLDTAKSRYQRNCLTQRKEETTKVSFLGKRMYRGLGVSMARSAITNAIFFSTFEFMKKRINSLELAEVD